MESLVKYGSDDDEGPSSSSIQVSDLKVESEEPKTVVTEIKNLETEWENFEKMLAGGDEESTGNTEAAIAGTNSTSQSPSTASSTVIPSSEPAPIAPLSNPYAYLSYMTAAIPTDGNALTSPSAADEMEKQLEEFLEKTAQAASDEAAKQSSTNKDAADNHSHGSSHSGSDHSGTESGSESDHSHHSGRSKSRSAEKDKSDTDRADKKDVKPVIDEERVAAIKRLDDLNKPEKTLPAARARRSGSPSRRLKSRRSRSRSRSRRSRSRSHSRRHRRRRSGSRSRHSGNRRRRRSGSRHRRRSHRSRSPRHRRDKDSDRHRSSRRRRSRRRSSSRNGRRRDPNRKAQYAFIATKLPSPPPPRTEDFKARMKRELQQAARDAIAGKGQATPQQALLQTMAAMHAKAQEITGVAVPKFYNPAAINPLKFAEQQQKRKLLWSKAAQNTEQSLQKFQGTEVIADEKYRKLMGIKGDVELTDMSEEQKQKQNELFHKLDQEYALARITTHTHRGMGLGVVSSIAAQSANEQFNRP